MTVTRRTSRFPPLKSFVLPGRHRACGAAARRAGGLPPRRARGARRRRRASRQPPRARVPEPSQRPALHPRPRSEQRRRRAALAARWQPLIGAGSGRLASMTATGKPDTAPSGRASSSRRSPGIENEPLYSADSVGGRPRPRPRRPGRVPVHARRLPVHVSRAASGRCASSRASAPPRRRTSASATCSSTGRPGLSTAFDMPTLMGYDSDHARSEGEVGREGVAIDSLADMETLFSGIPLGEVSTSMTINSPAAILLAFYLCVGEEQGVPRERAPRDDPDGHPQGVHRAEGVHLPAGAVDAARHGHGRVLRAGDAAVASDLDLRLPHPRGGLDRGAGARVHACRRLHVRRVGDRARASTSTTSRRGSPSSSTRTSTSSRRSRSTAPRAASGRR